MASQMMAFVFVCLQEKPAAIFELGNMADLTLDLRNDLPFETKLRLLVHSNKL